MFKNKLCLLLLAFLFVGCTQSVFIKSTPTPEQTNCKLEDVDKATAEMGELLMRFVDGEKIAGSTPRMSLAGPVAELQAIRRDATSLVVPQCLELAKMYLTLAMDNSIEGYLSFLADESDFQVNKHFEDAATNTKSYGAEMERVKECAPNCDT